MNSELRIASIVLDFILIVMWSFMLVWSHDPLYLLVVGLWMATLVLSIWGWKRDANKSKPAS
jgi:O-antigen/teichoic acid export membrane protein